MTTSEYAYRWRHYHIATVERFEAVRAYAVAVAGEPGITFVDDSAGVTPRVGDAISYYGRFTADGPMLGHAIDMLVIGERVIWDERERLHSARDDGTREDTQP